MSSLIIPKREIVSLDNCVLCDTGRKEVGSIGNMVSVVYKTGQDPAVDWLITLHRSNMSDLERGFTLMLMPVGHLTAFSQVNSSRQLAQNYGLTFARAHYGMQVIRLEEWRPEYGDFEPMVVDYGKCASPINTQKHIHVKTYTLDGSANQPSLSDTEWVKRDIFTEFDGSKYVKALPVVREDLGEERYEHLTKRLVDICSMT